MVEENDDIKLKILDQLEDCYGMREALKISEKMCGLTFAAYLGMIFLDTFKNNTELLENIQDQKGMLICIIAAAAVTYGIRKHYEHKTTEYKKEYNEIKGNEIFDTNNFYSDYPRLRIQRHNIEQSKK